MSLAPARQEELLAEVRALVASRGEARFVDGVVIEPTSEFFPDRWSPDESGIVALARRIFAYAGFADIGITIVERKSETTVDYRAPSAGGDDGVCITHDATGPAQLVAGDVGSCTVGVDFDELEDPSMLAASLCRIAALLFVDAGRPTYRNAPRRDAAHEEALEAAEVATVYLGFGILVANDAYRFFRRERRALETHVAGPSYGRGRHTQVHRTAGALDVDELCLLLAAQITARKAGVLKRRHVRSLLEETQRHAFDTYLRHLAGRDLLLDRRCQKS
jgi:hypothetical protein